MTMPRLFLTIFCLLATSTMGWSASIYTYTLHFDATAVTSETEVEFLSLKLLNGVAQIDPSAIDLNLLPFSGAVLRDDVNHLTISTSPGEVVVTIGEPSGTNNLYQFFALFPAATAVGHYAFTDATLVPVQNPSNQIAIPGGFLTIQERSLGANPVPEPTTIGMAGIGLALLAGGRQWRRWAKGRQAQAAGRADEKD
ncbi:PEP-CTERM sorting domain-containing protein [Paludibaculum fermentans]|uniref:PEP-CTERM sorting domain-containing protein n=1 Tax=Paludibaculum fermentans TaxID=1473598 RepID=A0A7S7NLL0_PALFE|nr:PEP-CTERM sorting domain-containing protein [Paludibaculum fermentans]QOY85858.1 PEP-CTERM sorting domain-containing protein [Paludibaculum fermentans]